MLSRLCCICGAVRSASLCAEQVFCTQSTIPEQPAPPRLINKTKQSLHIKWVPSIIIIIIYSEKETLKYDLFFTTSTVLFIGS